MWQAQYSQSLNSNKLLGTNFNYVIQIPPIANGDEYVRVALRAPTTGQCRVQAMYVGHGSGFSFDGNQVQITVNGQSSFTLSGGDLVYSDPISAVDCGFDTAKPVLVAYEILNGDYYRANTSLSSDFVMYWKAGTGDAATTAKAGYSSGLGRTALLEAVQFSDTLDIPEPEPEPIDEHVVNGYEQVLAGERHSSGDDLSGQADKHLHIQFNNPSNSGKIGLLYELEITPTADTVISFRSYPTPIGSAFPVKCNLFFGFGKALMEGRYSYESDIKGVFHSIHKVKGNQRNIIKLDVPLVALNPNWACVMVLHTKGIGGVVNIQWREIEQ